MAVAQMSNTADRQEALKVALARIQKTHGNDSVMIYGEQDEESQKVQTIPAGFLSIERALGVRGYPKGRIIEIYGPEASGKTLLTLACIAAVQKAGGVAAFIDAEQAFSPDWARKLGVDTDSLVFSQPNSGEQALSIAEDLIRSGAVDVLVVDSVAALVPQKEIDGEMGDATMGVQARLMSQGMRKLTSAINKSQTTVFFINQIRSKIGVMFGSPETTTGGNALKYYCSVRIDVRRIETLKDASGPIGNRTRAKIVKNKVAPPHKVAEYDLLFTEGNEGISREGDVIDMGLEYGLVTKSSSYHKFDGVEGNFQGKEKARAFLKANPEITDSLENRIRDLIFPPESVSDNIVESETEAELDLAKA